MNSVPGGKEVSGTYSGVVISGGGFPVRRARTTTTTTTTTLKGEINETAATSSENKTERSVSDCCGVVLSAFVGCKERCCIP